MQPKTLALFLCSLGTTLGAACVPAAPPAKPATSERPAKTVAPKLTQAPAAKTSPTPTKDASAEWQQMPEAAKREGTVVVVGGSGPEIATALTQGFRAKYPDIQVNFSGYPSNQFVPKISLEVASGQRITDVLVVGTTTMFSLIESNSVEPLNPYLVGPETRDESVWRGGRFNFSDSDRRYNLKISAYVKAPFIYNPAIVDPSDITSWKDLLDPKWKGKIATLDPRGGGASSDIAFFYGSPELGPEFIRQLFSHDVGLSAENLQLIDWVGRGQYPIAIGAGDPNTTQAIAKGVPIQRFAPEKVKEGTYFTSGNGTLGVVRNPPHPNAAKVYIDYLLSGQGQLEWSRAVGFASLRQDVPRDHVEDFLVPQPGGPYVAVDGEDYVRIRAEAVEFVRSLLSGS